MSDSRGSWTMDLERELCCSICTELLYQPLTLLDCLHTFCGFCLKEWFSTLASRRRAHSSSPKFTCPSCRAAVRETRPNATVNQLLDMFLTAHPDRARSAAEKNEIAQKYNQGDSVFPTSIRNSSSGSDEEDRRLVEEVRQLGLHESASRPRQSNQRRRQSSRSRPATHTDTDARGESENARHRRRREEEQPARRQAQSQTRIPTGGRDAGSESTQARRIEHQSSLRSLLSLSDAEAIEEEILRQILEEGLLDGIDLEHIEPGQEEEISERIAEAYRRRHRLGSDSRRRQEQQDSAARNPARRRARSQSTLRSTPLPATRDTSSNPREPHLLVPRIPPTGAPSEQGSRPSRTLPAPANQHALRDTLVQRTGRSSSDMTSERPRERRAPSALVPRRATESANASALIAREVDASVQQPISSSSATNSPTLGTPVRSSSPPSASPSHAEPPAPVSSAVLRPPGVANTTSREGRSRPSSSRSNASSRSLALFAEPSISCERCGRQDIQYGIYRKCAQCKDGNYTLCLRCYRLGRGCLHWSGFHSSARAKYGSLFTADSAQPAAPAPVTHTLAAFRYRRPPETSHRVVQENKLMTDNDPARRLESGLFCDICLSATNDCYWQCNQCNDGEWGFCNRCVNQGKCCTHPLLPIRRVLGPTTSTAIEVKAATDTPPRQPAVGLLSSKDVYNTLSMSTKCDICANSIPPSMTRFHCLACSDGDYDICPNCYLKLVATAKISKDNGHNGWRRCPKGHRMVIVGFQDHDEGQRRVVVKDLVGGRALKDDNQQSMSSIPTASTVGTTAAVQSPEYGLGDWSWKEGPERRKKASRVRMGLANNHIQIANNSHNQMIENAQPAPNLPATRRFPPAGGVGLIVQARWSWFPDDDVKDELLFPRGAEITEAENINDDWFWGCYAGATGLFPGPHVNVIGEVV